LPSTISRRRLASSTTVIFNMPHLSLREAERNAPTKDLRLELLDFQRKDATSRWRVETVKGELTAG
jgi:hypothetical protein